MRNAIIPGCPMRSSFLVPVLLKGGNPIVRPYGRTTPIELERTRVIESAEITHIRFRIVK